MLGPADNIGSMADRVVEALIASGLTQDDILDGAMPNAVLPWQVPPLVIDTQFTDGSVEDHIYAPRKADTERLYALWSDSLAVLRNSPYSVLTPVGYRQAHLALPGRSKRDLLLRLSLPEGYPDGVSDLAGVVLSLECAHAAQRGARVADFISDDSNYFVVLEDGREIGVKDGLPALWGDVWDIPVTGVVQDMLRAPRGNIWEGSDYNVLSRVREVISLRAADIVDYMAVDWLLQALRVVGGETELLRSVKRMKYIRTTQEGKLSALTEAWEVATRIGLPDRNRVATLRTILVPSVMGAKDFGRKIFSLSASVPPVLSTKALGKLQQSVRDMLDEEAARHSKNKPRK